jgi:hypothetical protein
VDAGSDDGLADDTTTTFGSELVFDFPSDARCDPACEVLDPKVNPFLDPTRIVENGSKTAVAYPGRSFIGSRTARAMASGPIRDRQSTMLRRHRHLSNSWQRGPDHGALTGDDDAFSI